MSDNQIAQLTQAIQAMDKKFDKRLDAMDKKFDNQFTKLFKYMNQEFKSVRDEIAEVKGSVNTYSNGVDEFMKRMETYDQERLALGHKVDRQEKWHEQTAKAVGIKLSA